MQVRVGGGSYMRQVGPCFEGALPEEPPPEVVVAEVEPAHRRKTLIKRRLLRPLRAPGKKEGSIGRSMPPRNTEGCGGRQDSGSREVVQAVLLDNQAGRGFGLQEGGRGTLSMRAGSSSRRPLQGSFSAQTLPEVWSSSTPKKQQTYS